MDKLHPRRITFARALYTPAQARELLRIHPDRKSIIMLAAFRHNSKELVQNYISLEGVDSAMDEMYLDSPHSKVDLEFLDFIRASGYGMTDYARFCLRLQVALVKEGDVEKLKSARNKYGFKYNYEKLCEGIRHGSSPAMIRWIVEHVRETRDGDGVLLSAAVRSGCTDTVKWLFSKNVSMPFLNRILYTRAGLSGNVEMLDLLTQRGICYAEGMFYELLLVNQRITDDVALWFVQRAKKISTYSFNCAIQYQPISVIKIIQKSGSLEADMAFSQMFVYCALLNGDKFSEREVLDKLEWIAATFGTRKGTITPSTQRFEHLAFTYGDLSYKHMEIYSTKSIHTLALKLANVRIAAWVFDHYPQVLLYSVDPRDLTLGMHDFVLQRELFWSGEYYADMKRRNRALYERLRQRGDFDR